MMNEVSIAGLKFSHRGVLPPFSLLEKVHPAFFLQKIDSVAA
jgi:hypothetical protein